MNDPKADSASSHSRIGPWISFGLMFVAICVIIVAANAGSTNPVFRVVKSIPYGDKVIHALLFGLLAYLANRALGFRHLQFRWLQIGSLGVLVLALGEELTQGLNPHRSLDALDAAADIGGVAIATWVSAHRMTKEANADSPP